MLGSALGPPHPQSQLQVFVDAVFWTFDVGGFECGLLHLTFVVAALRPQLIHFPPTSQPSIFRTGGCTAKSIFVQSFSPIVDRHWKSASAGNRTRVTSMATMYSTTRPLMLLVLRLQKETLLDAGTTSLCPRGFKTFQRRPFFYASVV